MPRKSGLAAAELPLSLPEFATTLAAIGGFEPRPLVAVGVSGGPDSLALVILADRWARERGGAAWGLIVDHGLRPESAAEAETVSAWLEARDIPQAVLAWCGEKPSAGIQEAARTARYRLLAQWCAERGCCHLFTAHHREDQAETYLIRRRAGSGTDGLAGMAVVRELPTLRHVRPLLSVAKARLAAFLAAEAQPCLRDPSNRNPAFERARWRFRLENGGEDAEMALREVRANAAMRISREHELALLLAQTVALYPAGIAVIDPAPIAAAGELGERALGRIAAVIGGGTPYPIRRERLARLRGALGETPVRSRTLGGCRFVGWRGRVLALREAARAAPRLLLAPGTTSVWDERFMAVMPAAASPGLELGQLGTDGVAVLGRDGIGEDNPLPRLAYPVLPAIWDDEGPRAVPHLGWRRGSDACLPVLMFRPRVPLFAAGFTVV